MSEHAESLLVVKTSQPLTQEQAERIKQAVMPAADRLGLEVIVAGDGLDVDIHQDMAPLLKELLTEAKQQTAAINRLTDLQEQILMAMADDADPDAEPVHYMDGSPVR